MFSTQPLLSSGSLCFELLLGRSNIWECDGYRWQYRWTLTDAVQRAAASGIGYYDGLCVRCGVLLRREVSFILKKAFGPVLLKMPLHQLFSAARSGPMSAINGGSPANDEAYN